ncbi:MAG: prepilin peptidase, partial [Bacteroidota bacterium]
MLLELLLFFILGLAVGSFVTVVVERLDTVESFWIGRSHCNHCKKVLSWWELLPFISFLILKGRCIRCNRKIPILYPIFELITGLSFLGLRIATPSPTNYWLLVLELIVITVLLILCFYDWVNQAFPAHVLYLALVLVAILAVVHLSLGTPQGRLVNITDPLFHWLSTPNQAVLFYLYGGIVGAGILGLLAFPSKGTWMGYGDVFVGGIIGLWLGYPFVLIALLLAFYGGAFIG